MPDKNEAWKKRFIAELRIRGFVQDACAAIGVCKDSAYDERKRSDLFATQWAEAVAQARARAYSTDVETLGGYRRGGKRLPHAPPGSWHDKFFDELRICGIVKDAAHAAGIAPTTAYIARRKAIRTHSESRTEEGREESAECRVTSWSEEGTGLTGGSAPLTINFAERWEAALAEAVARNDGNSAVPFRSALGISEGARRSGENRVRRARVSHGSWHEKFFAELSVCGIVKEAARAAHVDPNTVHAARRKSLRERAENGGVDPSAIRGAARTRGSSAAPTKSFAARWEEAIEEAVEQLEQEAWRRASAGVDRPVFYKGRRVGSVKAYNDKLLILLLKANRPRKYRDSAPLPVELAPETRALLEKYYEAIGRGK